MPRQLCGWAGVTRGGAWRARVTHAPRRSTSSGRSGRARDHRRRTRRADARGVLDGCLLYGVVPTGRGLPGLDREVDHHLRGVPGRPAHRSPCAERARRSPETQCAQGLWSMSPLTGALVGTEGTCAVTLGAPSGWSRHPRPQPWLCSAIPTCRPPPTRCWRCFSSPRFRSRTLTRARRRGPDPRRRLGRPAAAGRSGLAVRRARRSGTGRRRAVRACR